MARRDPSSASSGPRRHFEGHNALLEAVSSLQKLKELSPDEVDAAFWVGARIAEVYMPLSCTAAKAVECQEVDLQAPPPIPYPKEWNNQGSALGC